MTIEPQAPGEAREAIASLVIAFNWAIDRGQGKDMGRFFTEDAEFHLPDPANGWRPAPPLEGREAIAARWQDRSPLLVTRHVTVNLEIELREPDSAAVRSVGLGFRHDGEGLGIPMPVVVADYDDLCRRCEDGLWRFQERRISAVFVDPSLVLSR